MTCDNKNMKGEKAEPFIYDLYFHFFNSTRTVRSIVHWKISTEPKKNVVRSNYSFSKDPVVMMIYNLLRFLFVEISFVRYKYHIHIEAKIYNIMP